MAEETQAASSPAEVEDVFNGQQVSLSEFSRYRQDGELPERFKPADKADSTPADAPEKTDKTEGEDPKPAPDSDPDTTQELPPKTSEAEKRIKQLLAKNKELEAQIAAKQDVKTESSPAPTPQTRTKPAAEDKNQDGTPKYSTYEDFVEELADWKAEQRLESAKREQVQQEAQKVLKGKLDEARARYDDADDVIFPANQAIQNAKMPLVVKEVIAQSAEFVDLLYVVGSDPEELKKFIELAQTNPRAAIGKVFEYERGIREELSPKNDTPRDDKGKFTAPEPKKTSAPKPPSPVGGASSRAFDVSDESLSPEEWARKRTKDLQSRG
jgi:hypothetical protein